MSVVRGENSAARRPVCKQLHGAIRQQCINEWSALHGGAAGKAVTQAYIAFKSSISDVRAWTPRCHYSRMTSSDRFLYLQCGRRQDELKELYL